MKKTKRSKNKLASLEKGLNLKTRTEELDFDYISKLSPEHQDYMATFVEEYVHADFRGAKLLHQKTKGELDSDVKLLSLFKDISKILKKSIPTIKKMKYKELQKERFIKLINTFLTTFEKKINRQFKMNKYKLDSYDRNNARNDCALSKSKAQGITVYLEEIGKSYTSNNNVEDDLIDMIDKKRSGIKED